MDHARTAGMTFLRRHRRDHHYGLYLLACGHVVKRQFGFVERVAAGRTDVRCDRCLIAREQEEASVVGWQRLGRDRQGNPTYRLYRHSCGHEQRVARVNMVWRQVKCAACGGAWNAAPSSIYLLRVEVPHRSLHVLKLGFSKHPVKRMKHQLGLPGSARVELIRVLPMANGHDACARETAAHAWLREHLPQAVVPAEAFAGLLNVKSEIYEPWAYDAIMSLIDRIEGTQPRP